MRESHGDWSAERESTEYPHMASSKNRETGRLLPGKFPLSFRMQSVLLVEISISLANYL